MDIYSSFLNRKHSSVQNELLKQKYDDINKLLSKSSCKFVIKHHYHHPPPQVVTRKKLGNDMDKSKKTLINIWNVLNDSNYNRILGEINVIIANQNNLTTIIDDIIKYSIIHVHYMHLFINILKVLLNSYDSNSIIKIIQSFSDDYMYNRKYVYKDDIDLTTDYDQFCKKTKHKNNVKNTYGFFIAVEKHIDQSIIDIDQHTNFIVDEMNSRLDDDYYTDLFLNIVADVFRVFPELKIKYAGVLSKVKYSTQSFKNKFLIEQLSI